MGGWRVMGGFDRCGVGKDGWMDGWRDGRRDGRRDM